MKLLIRLTLLYTLLTVGSFVWAQESVEGLFGSEWTLTNSQLVQDYRNGYQILRGFEHTSTWIDLIEKNCPQCKVERGFKTVDKALGINIELAKVTLPSGIWFELTYDPLVIEIKATPMSLRTLKENAKQLQFLVFDLAKKATFTPHERLVGGHISLDIKTHFGGNELLMRNFVVDLMNRPELFMGGLSLDYLNAKPLAVHSVKDIKKYQELLKKYDSGKVSWDRFRHEVLVYIHEIHQKSEAIYIREDRIEIRGSRPQIGMEHYIALVTMFEKRIKELSKINTPIPFAPKTYNHLVSKTYGKNIIEYTTKLHPSMVLRAVREYARDAILDPYYFDGFVTEELNRAMKYNQKDISPMSCKKLFNL